MIGFAGLSHLGIVTSIAVASKGFEVSAFDGDSHLCEQLRRGCLPIVEPDLPELLAKNRNHVEFTSDVSTVGACDVVYVSKDVPTDERNRSDLSALRRLINDVVSHMQSGATLVVLSQVPPGFTRQLSHDLRSMVDERDLQIYYQVETLIFGRAVERALHPERYIIGCNDPRTMLPKTYADLLAAFGCPLLPMRYESAELAKISINIFLTSSVTASNMLAELCETIGADWAEIVPALRLDRRIGQHAYLSPGLGISGGNLERDLCNIEKRHRRACCDIQYPFTPMPET
ncbi:MAG TPA: UDP-glucose/GDP-mannose dehydrogenase family protein, partial [Nitrospirales bacterium]|nr:UDP-glucose/GDP-mannose dehydrogenase family protein [Nitrospirales bacterium]